ncbi:hypothecial protein [Mycoreovirus 3]|uniref:Hypothecial protein n=1 Tax=Rosellinia necatrix mycoreovirus 3 (isolate W370) TaxID=311229 RepID=Q76H86_MYRVW|nr:hypothecial protein [Mycoreovirus 3]BAC98432.1 hypothecial protein [Mycoreovirus 3]
MELFSLNAPSTLQSQFLPLSTFISHINQPLQPHHIRIRSLVKDVLINVDQDHPPAEVSFSHPPLDDLLFLGVLSVRTFVPLEEVLTPKRARDDPAAPENRIISAAFEAGNSVLDGYRQLFSDLATTIDVAEQRISDWFVFLPCVKMCMQFRMLKYNIDSLRDLICVKMSRDEMQDIFLRHALQFISSWHKYVPRSHHLLRPQRYLLVNIDLHSLSWSLQGKYVAYNVHFLESRDIRSLDLAIRRQSRPCGYHPRQNFGLLHYFSFQDVSDMDKRQTFLSLRTASNTQRGIAMTRETRVVECLRTNVSCSRFVNVLASASLVGYCGVDVHIKVEKDLESVVTYVDSICQRELLREHYVELFHRNLWGPFKYYEMISTGASTLPVGEMLNIVPRRVALSDVAGGTNCRLLRGPLRDPLPVSMYRRYVTRLNVVDTGVESRYDNCGLVCALPPAANGTFMGDADEVISTAISSTRYPSTSRPPVLSVPLGDSPHANAQNVGFKGPAAEYMSSVVTSRRNVLPQISFDWIGGDSDDVRNARQIVMRLMTSVDGWLLDEDRNSATDVPFINAAIFSILVTAQLTSQGLAQTASGSVRLTCVNTPFSVQRSMAWIGDVVLLNHAYVSPTDADGFNELGGSVICYVDGMESDEDETLLWLEGILRCISGELSLVFLVRRPTYRVLEMFFDSLSTTYTMGVFTEPLLDNELGVSIACQILEAPIALTMFSATALGRASSVLYSVQAHLVHDSTLDPFSSWLAHGDAVQFRSAGWKMERPESLFDDVIAYVGAIAHVGRIWKWLDHNGHMRYSAHGRVGYCRWTESSRLGDELAIRTVDAPVLKVSRTAPDMPNEVRPRVCDALAYLSAWTATWMVGLTRADWYVNVRCVVDIGGRDGRMSGPWVDKRYVIVDPGNVVGEARQYQARGRTGDPLDFDFVNPDITIRHLIDAGIFSQAEFDAGTVMFLFSHVIINACRTPTAQLAAITAIRQRLVGPKVVVHNCGEIERGQTLSHLTDWRRYREISWGQNKWISPKYPSPPQSIAVSQFIVDGWTVMHPSLHDVRNANFGFAHVPSYEARLILPAVILSTVWAVSF